jgi:hypothetical protein
VRVELEQPTRADVRGAHEPEGEQAALAKDREERADDGAGRRADEPAGAPHERQRREHHAQQREGEAEVGDGEAAQRVADARGRLR